MLILCGLCLVGVFGTTVRTLKFAIGSMQHSGALSLLKPELKSIENKQK